MSEHDSSGDDNLSCCRSTRDQPVAYRPINRVPACWQARCRTPSTTAGAHQGCGSFPATHHHPITRTEIDVTAHPNASARDYPQADSQYPDPDKAPPLQPDEIYNLAAQSHLAVVCSAAFLMRLSASISAHRHCEEAQPTRQSRGLAFRVVKRPMQREIVRGWNGIATSAAPLRNGMRTGVAPNSPFPTSRFSPTGFQRAVS